MGGGHDGAAYELARRLEARGWQVDVRDYLQALPFSLGFFLRWVYAAQLRVAPGSYQLLYRGLERAWPLLVAAKCIAGWARPRLRRWTRAGSYDVVVSTYPLASQALGQLRRRRRLETPVVTYLTDFSVHPLWVSRNVDAHVALHPAPAAQARRMAAGIAVRVGGPLVRPEFFVRHLPAQRSRVRNELGIPADVTVALIVAGSWGVGDVRATAAELVATGAAHPLVVCGRNEALAAELRLARLGSVVGWVEDMAALMAAADVIVQNAGGLTSLEAFAAGLPVLSYRCIPGHGRSNAEAMAAAGVAAHGCMLPSLAGAIKALDRSRQRARAADLFAADPTDLVEAAAEPDVRRVVPRRRAGGLHRVGTVAAASLVLFAAGTSGVAAAASRGVGVLHPSEVGEESMFLVVRGAPEMTPQLESLLKESHAALAIPGAGRQGTEAAEAAAAGIPVVLDGPARAPAVVTRDGRQRPIVLVHRRTNAVELSRAFWRKEAVLVPRAVLRADVPGQLPRGAVIVVDGSSQQLVAVLESIIARAAAQRVQLDSVTQFAGLAA